MTRLNIEEFHSACASVLHERESAALKYAVNYASAGLRMESSEMIQTQCLYILGSITHWRGDTAKRSRLTFKRLAKPESWKVLA